MSHKKTLPPTLTQHPPPPNLQAIHSYLANTDNLLSKITFSGELPRYIHYP